MSHRFSVEFGVPGFDWDEMTEHVFCQSNWRRIKPVIRWCKKNKVRYAISRYR